MPPRLTVEFQHSSAELWSAYQASTCAVERRRLQVLALLSEGRSKADVLAITRYSVPRYLDVLHRYRASGLEGLKDRRHTNPGAPTLLSDAELLLLAQTLRADFAEGRVWNGKQVQAWVHDTLGKDIHLARAYEFLDAVAFSLQSPRPQHVQANEVEQEAFKKTRSQPLSRRLARLMR